jgi:SNF2 family DNA or RNA helicase
MKAIDIATKLYKGRVPQGVPMEQRTFQDEAVDKLAKYPKHILGDPMGTGKTVTGIRALKAFAPRRSLIIPTERAVLSWLKAMWQWHPEMLDQYVILGKFYNQQQRRRFWDETKKFPSLNVICNYHTVVRDKDSLHTNWDSVIMDEFHKFMRNRDTQMHRIAKSLRTEQLLMVSGSPSTKGAIDLFIPLQLFDPKLFSSYWRFAETWCNVIETTFGKDIYGYRNEEQFKKVLHPYAIIRSKKELDLQKKQREIVELRMTPAQEAAYSSIRDDFLLELDDKPPMVMLNTLAQYQKLRQILACPAILSPSLGVGASAEYVRDTLIELPVEERHAVVFTPFKGALPLLKAYFEGIGDAFGLPEPGVNIGVPVFLFQGGMGFEKLFEQLHAWKTRGGLAICTVDFAESFDMETADKCFFIGYSWDPQVNFQAEDRLDRLNNPHGLINCYYLACQGTIDQDILYTLASKQKNVNQLYGTAGAMKDLLRKTNNAF